jgi:WD40 repeat protein
MRRSLFAVWMVICLLCISCTQEHETSTATIASTSNATTLTPITVSTADFDDEGWPIVRRLRSSAWFYDIAWSPDGSRIATSIGDVDAGISQLQVYDVATGKLLYTRDTPSIYPTTHVIAWAHNKNDLSLLAAGGLGSEIIVWDGDTGEELYRLDNGNRSTLFEIAFNAHATLLADARIQGVDGQAGVTLWNINHGREDVKFPAIDRYPEVESVGNLAWWPTHNRLELVTKDDTIVSWDLDTQEINSVTISSIVDPLIEISPDSSKMIFGSDLDISILNAADYSLLHIFDTEYTIYDAIFSPDSKVLAIATFDYIVLLDVNTGQVIDTIDQYGIQDLAWSPDGTMLAAVGTEITIYLIENSKE